MRHGIVLLPEQRWSAARDRWRRAEELGFDHAWTYDHLMWRWLRDETWFGCLPTLTAAAGVTSKMRLGSLVATPTFRHPVPFAKELMTLDDIMRRAADLRRRLRGRMGTTRASSALDKKAAGPGGSRSSSS